MGGFQCCQIVGGESVSWQVGHVCGFTIQWEPIRLARNLDSGYTPKFSGNQQLETSETRERGADTASPVNAVLRLQGER